MRYRREADGGEVPRSAAASMSVWLSTMVSLLDDAVRAFERLRVQAAAELAAFAEYRMRAHPHQLVAGEDARDAGGYDRDPGAVFFGRHDAEPGGMRDPVVKSERKVEPEHRYGAVGGFALGASSVVASGA